MPLDLEEQLTHPRSPLRSVFLDTLFSPRFGPSTFILDQHDDQTKLLGLAQLRARPGRPERDVVFMAPRLENGAGSHLIWQRLLTHLCIQTAERGGLRIYARLPLSSEEVQVFKNVGFIEYGQEDIYRLEQSTAPITPPLQLRLQESGDGWGLQQLYASLTPRGVQNAEGLAQGQWDLNRRRWGEQGRRMGYVWEVDGELVAALHLRAGNCGYWIRTLLHPDALEHAHALGLSALALTAARSHLPVYFAVRQYEAGWSGVLPGLGFQPLTSQVLMVRPMAIRVREKTPGLIAALESSPTEGAAPSLVTRLERMEVTVKKGQP